MDKRDIKLSELIDDAFKGVIRNGHALSSSDLEAEEFDKAPSRKKFCFPRRKREKPMELLSILNNPQDKLSSLFLAAREGDELGIKQIVQQTGVFSSWLNTLDDSGFAPLHHAARFNQVKSAKCLLGNGAKIDVRGKDDVTPLHVATRYKSVEMVKLLVKGGADVNSPNACGGTALSLASRLSNITVVEILLSHGNADVNTKDYNDDTPLHQACAYGGHSVVELLLKKGADSDVLNSDNRTPLHSAVCLYDDSSTVELLIKHATSKGILISRYVNSSDSWDNTALHLAAQNGFDDVIDLLIDHQADVHAVNADHQTALHLACSGGHLKVVNKLIISGANVNAEDAELKTPMHRAASNNHKDLVKTLYLNGASRNKRDMNYVTPLMCAAAQGHLDTAHFLLESGADLTACDRSLKTCLHYALESQAYETLRMLMENGGKQIMNKGDINDCMPIHYAATLPTTQGLEILTEHGCLLNPKNISESTPLHLAVQHNRLPCVQLLCRISPVQMNDDDDQGRTPLHLAAVTGRRKVCLFLLRCGARLSAKDTHRRTPVHYAAENGSRKVLEDMIQHKASLDDVENSNNTALHLAVKNAHAQIVKILLDADADVMKRNDEGHTCLDIAIENSDADVAMEIIKHDRGRDIMYYRGPDGHKPLGKLIEYLPDVAECVLNQSVQRTRLPRNHPDYTVTYDFRLLDPGPDDESALDGKRFFALKTMVKHKREKLLCHPLCKRLLEIKWNSVGRYLFYFNTLFYLIFLTAFTMYIMDLRYRYKVASWDFQVKTNFNLLPKSCRNDFQGKYFYFTDANNTVIEVPDSEQILYEELLRKNITIHYDDDALDDDLLAEQTYPHLPFFLFIVILLQLIKELFQICSLRKEYFKDFTNLLEWGMYTSSLIIIVPSTLSIYQCFIAAPWYWMVASTCIFVAWLNLFLFLRRVGEMGVYVSMLFFVLKTVVKVTLMFAILLEAFGIVFFLLLKEQAAFGSLELSNLKVIVMTIGEMDYTNVFVNSASGVNEDTKAPLLPLPTLSKIFFLMFCFMMPIIFMNLLVGLAVGDIDKIQKGALLQKISMQVDFVSDIEDRYPNAIIRLFYKPRLIIRPNQVKQTRLAKFLRRRKKKTKPRKQHDSDAEDLQENENRDEGMMEKLQADLQKQKLKMKCIHEAVDDLKLLVKGIAQAVHAGNDNDGEI